MNDEVRDGKGRYPEGHPRDRRRQRHIRRYQLSPARLHGAGRHSFTVRGQLRAVELVIGTGVYVDDVDQAYWSSIGTRLSINVAIMLVIVALGVLIARSGAAPAGRRTRRRGAGDEACRGRGPHRRHPATVRRQPARRAFPMLCPPDGRRHFPSPDIVRRTAEGISVTSARSPRPRTARPIRLGDGRRGGATDGVDQPDSESAHDTERYPRRQPPLAASGETRRPAAAEMALIAQQTSSAAGAIRRWSPVPPRSRRSRT